MRIMILGSLVLTLFVPAMAPTDFGQDEVAFSGRVLNGEDETPIASAQVWLDATGHSTRTGPTGEYALQVPAAQIPPGTIRLIAQRIGYESDERVVDASRDLADGAINVDFRLRPARLQLDELVVKGTPGESRERDANEPAQRAQTELSVPRSFSTDMGGGRPGPAIPAGWNREQYDHIEENDFRTVAGNPLSTFSIDVDRASYSNVRRFLHEGRIPPTDAVRIEELVNYFPYDYELPGAEHPVAVTTEIGAAPWQENHLLLRIGLASEPVQTDDIPASNLVFLLDVSGSMDSPDKLPLVQRSMRLLVNELRPFDRVAIVVYAGAAGLALDSTPGSRKERILHAIENLRAGGSTAGGAGLRLAYRVARANFLEDGNNRVILATDGDFNVGESSDSEMIRLIEEMRGQGTFLTVLGFGTGNLQSEKMQALAQNGNGNYGYIDSIKEAHKILVSEMGGTLLTVAQDVKLQVEFNPTQVHAYRLIGYENRLLAAEDFANDVKDAGDLGAGHRVTALYEVIPVGVDTDVEVRGTDALRYQRPNPLSSRATEGELAFVRIRYKSPRGDESRLMEHPVRPERGAPSEDFNFAAAVAGFGMLLRDSEHRGSISSEQVLSLAREGQGSDIGGYRRGFIELVQTYDQIRAAIRH